MDLLEFIEKTEQEHFRTHWDIGGSFNARFVWNQLREFAGLPRLTKHDLMRRTIDLLMEDAMKAKERGDDTHYREYLASIKDLEEELSK